MRRWWPALAAVAAVIVGSGWDAGTAQAIPIDPTDNPCVSASSGSVSVSNHAVRLGQTVNVVWDVNDGPGCVLPTYLVFQEALTGRRFMIDKNAASYAPPASGQYIVEVFSAGRFYDMGSDSVSVTLPTVNGHPMASITGGGPQAATFVQAASTPNAVVAVRDDVELDLSGGTSIEVAGGVRIIGERSAAHPGGPHLFTTTFQDALLEITHDDVRITGIRLQGAEGSDPCDQAGVAYDSNAVNVLSAQHVEIDHDEFYRWSGATVNVRDPGGVIGRGNADTVLVHDNVIHDNQHPTICTTLSPDDPNGHGGGYGVSVGRGAYVTVRHNYFSDNRHSIEANGDDGDGYIADGNLFLRPGVDDVKVFTNYNHLIDVHAQQTCGSGEHFNCGPAGEYFSVTRNTVVGIYTAPNSAAAIQLRGTPTSYSVDPATGGMRVSGNAFSGSEAQALTQTQTGLVQDGGNTFNSPQAGFYDTGSGQQCDFDGDGNADAFRAYASEWWYHSSLLSAWQSLGDAQPGAVTLRDVNGDGRCDVSTPNLVSYTAPVLRNPSELNVTMPSVYLLPQDQATQAIISAGLAVGSVSASTSTLPKGTVIAATYSYGTVQLAGTPVNLLVSNGSVTVPNVVGSSQAAATARLNSDGLTVGTVSRVMNPASPGTVIAQSVAPNTLIASGSAVNLTVSLGQVTVPNVSGLRPDSAVSVLTAAGLGSSVSNVKMCISYNEVLDQSPNAGDAVIPGTVVTITVDVGTFKDCGPPK